METQDCLRHENSMALDMGGINMNDPHKLEFHLLFHF